MQLRPALSSERGARRSLVQDGEQLLARSLPVPPTEIRYLGFTTPNHTAIHAGRGFMLAVRKGTLGWGGSACPPENPCLTMATPAEAHMARLLPPFPGGLQKYQSKLDLFHTICCT